MDSKMIAICALIVAGLAVCAIATFNAINDNGHDERPSGPTLEDAVLKLADEHERKYST